jgi:hypothetical protein
MKNANMSKTKKKYGNSKNGGKVNEFLFFLSKIG